MSFIYTKAQSFLHSSSPSLTPLSDCRLLEEDDVVPIKLLITLNSLFLVVATKPSFKEIRIGSPSLPANQSSASTDGSGPIVSG